MKENRRIVMALLIVLVIAVAVFVYTNYGLKQGNVLADAYERLEIPESYIDEVSYNDNIVALLSYDSETLEHVFAVYLDDFPLSNRFSFSSSSRSSYIMNSIEVHMYEQGGVVVSMNKDKVAKIELEGNNEDRVINVNPDKPFIITMFPGMSIKRISDLNGQEVDYTSYQENN